MSPAATHQWTQDNWQCPTCDTDAFACDGARDVEMVRERSTDGATGEPIYRISVIAYRYGRWVTGPELDYLIGAHSIEQVQR
jgi:hypothetical protein